MLTWRSTGELTDMWLAAHPPWRKEQDQLCVVMSSMWQAVTHSAVPTAVAVAPGLLPCLAAPGVFVQVLALC
jgi:hypothetical protein